MDPVLETKRLLLRKFTMNDLDDYFNIMKQPEMGIWLRGADDGVGFTIEQTTNWIKMFDEVWLEYGYGPFAMVLKDSNELIGHCGLKFHKDQNWTEMMYGLHPEYWGKGYVTEACKECLDWGFTKFDIVEVFDYTLPTNKGSIRVKEKLGYTYQKNFDYKGFDHVLYKITKSDFYAKR